MAAIQGIIRFHQDDQRTHFRIEGQATMKQSLAFRRFAENALGDPCRTLWIDLRDCTFLDSTFVGTLLNLLRTANRRGPDGFALIAPSAACVEILQQMGVYDLFCVMPAEAFSSTCAWLELTRETEDATAFHRNILQAHEELANVPGATGESFRAVVRCLSKELNPDCTPKKS